MQVKQLKQCQRRIMRFMAMGVMTVAVGMASSVQAQTTANGPYYATPSWDQTLPAATRFIVLSNFNNEAVLDRNTGLVWMKRAGSEPTRSWQTARSGCAGQIVGGQLGWRLPAMAELASLIDGNAVSGPALPAGHPFTVPLDLTNPNFLFWSATTDAFDPRFAWGVYFGGGGPEPTLKTTLAGTWCVRGGMNADQY